MTQEQELREKFEYKFNSLHHAAIAEIFNWFLENIPQEKQEPFIGFWSRLHSFVENVRVNDPMSEEEKEMILQVCKTLIV